MSTDNKNLSEVEHIKDKSNYLRGTIKESLENDLTGSLYSDDINLIKFHGSYQQTDRDLDSERKKQKLEPLYSFMIRVRMPAGVSTTKQWLAMDALADKYGNGTMKLTTRMTYQLHGILKRDLKPTMQEINKALLDTIAACGDVNRNVMSSANIHESEVHKEAYDHAAEISKHLLPRTTAYHEIWLDNKLISGNETDEEPIYGKTYLPRKFKIAIAVPPYNDVDVFANDLGFIAIADKGKLIGYNVVVGGGMGYTFGNLGTYPRLGDVIGYIPKDKVVVVAENIMTIQRDNGNRSDRKLSRFKYTVDKLGLESIRNELNKRLGWNIEPAKPYTFITNNDRFGWYKGLNNTWNVGLFIEGGRIVDTDKYKLKTGLKEIALAHDSTLILTGNQNLIIADIDEKNKSVIENILNKYEILQNQNKTAIRAHSLACVALNTCTLAFADAERYLPSLLDKIDKVIEEAGLAEVPINIRMTGCPNGCARPFLGEIGLVGRAPGKYNLYLGAAHEGNRLNRLYKEMIGETEILSILTPFLQNFAKERNKDEHFGDYVLRKGIISYKTPVDNFHQTTS